MVLYIVCICTYYFRGMTGAGLKLKQIDSPMDRKDCDRIALTYGTVLFMAFDLNLYVLDPCHGSRTPHPLHYPQS